MSDIIPIKTITGTTYVKLAYIVVIERTSNINLQLHMRSGSMFFCNCISKDEADKFMQVAVGEEVANDL